MTCTEVNGTDAVKKLAELIVTVTATNKES